VHIRRTDFINHPIYSSSSAAFVQASVHFVRNQTINSSIVILIGDDVLFANEIIRNNNNTYGLPINIEHPEMHLAFAARHCHSIIQTAARSSFGWWLAYLSVNARNIYYNADYHKDNRIDGELVADDFFPKDWIALQFDQKTSTIVTNIVNN
jgi:hypothetical protein